MTYSYTYNYIVLKYRVSSRQSVLQSTDQIHNHMLDLTLAEDLIDA